MELYPAIDVRGGRCVRLAQGDFARETVYDDDPVAVARGFAAAGARWIHVVDLDAARTGRPDNSGAIAAVVAEVRPLGVRVQVGGGVRSTAPAVELWERGVDRVVVGTAAVEDPGLVGALARLRPGAVAVGLDARDGVVAVRGWETTSGRALVDVVAGLDVVGLGAVVVTDIGRDGMLTGPDLAGLQLVLERTTVDVIASGGVGSVDDIRALASLRASGAEGRAGVRGARGLAGVIVGRALYEGRLTVDEGMRACAASV